MKKTLQLFVDTTTTKAPTTTAAITSTTAAASTTTAPATTPTTTSYACPNGSPPLAAGPTPAGQQPPLLLYEVASRKVSQKVDGVGSTNGLAESGNSIRLHHDSAIVLLPNGIDMNGVMSLSVTIENDNEADFDLLVAFKGERRRTIKQKRVFISANIKN